MASHLELEWEEPRVRDFWETIGHHHTVVRYDRQGCGLSDRNRSDFSLDSEIRTIDAIVKELGLKSFVLWGQRHGGAPAIGYAVRSPDRVSQLILCGAHDRSLSRAGAITDTYRGLVLLNWRMASLAMVETMLGGSFDAASLQWYFRLLREGVTPEIFAQLITFWWNMDVRDLLLNVNVPKLVVHYRKDRYIPFEAGAN